MKIGIPLSKNSYTPEAYAYNTYLSSKSWQVQLDYDLDPNNDINIFFMGMRPFWQKSKGLAIEIHEYQSLSTPHYARVKNYIKKRVNKRPSARIFLNEFVHQSINFNDDIPYTYRDMGVDKVLFQTPSENPLYDIVYCGSISGRSGLIETLLNLSKSYKIAVVGRVTEQEQILLQIKNISLLGQVSRDQLPEIYSNAHFGLNYTPDIYPFNIQTSTKTLEYLASGLNVISNKYFWVEDFFKKISYQPIWLDESIALNIDNLLSGSINIPNMEHYSWRNVLDRSNLDGFLRDIMNESI